MNENHYDVTNSSGYAYTTFTSPTSAGYAGITAMTAGSTGAYTSVACYSVNITTPGSYPVYIGTGGSVNLAATVEPSGTSGTYSWSQVSGPGGGTFSSPNSASTSFSAGTPGFYAVEVEFSAGGGSDADVSGDIVVFGVSVNPDTREIADGASGGQFEALVQPASVIPYNWGWTWEAPAGAGNNPICTFSPAGQKTTTLSTKWFALPDNPCSASLSSTYDINCNVTVGGSQFSDPTPAKLTITLPITGGTTTPRGLTGFPDYAYDINDNLWKVTGTGTLAKQVPIKVINVLSTSQFYNKIDQHETKHVNDIVDGFNGHQFWTVTEFYPTVQNLTNATESGLVTAIESAYSTYDTQETAEFYSLVSTFEQRAYQVSDPIAPQYVYQNCGRY